MNFWSCTEQMRTHLVTNEHKEVKSAKPTPKDVWFPLLNQTSTQNLAIILKLQALPSDINEDLVQAMINEGIWGVFALPVERI